jgi:integrase
MSILLSDAVDEFLNYRRMGHSKATARLNTVALKKFLVVVGNIQTRNLGPQHAERYQSTLIRAGLAPGSINSYMNALRAFSKWGDAHRYMNGAIGATCRSMPIPPRPRLRVPQAEFERLLDSAERPEDRILVALGLYAFLRASEATALQISDIDLAHDVMHVHVKKTSQADEMPICWELGVELRRWLEVYSAAQPLEPSHHLVPARRRFMSWLPSDEPTWEPKSPMGYPARRIQITLATAGFSVRDHNGKTNREGVHTLRRSGARAYYDEMISAGNVRDDLLRQVMTMLHHSSVVTTERYLGLEGDREKRDLRLRGQPMFRPIERDNVVQLKGEGR